MKPLVSCICITQNRRFFLRQAAHYFERAQQEFIRHGAAGSSCTSELIILDGSPNENREWRITDSMSNPSIRYFHEPSPPHAKTGALHNRACELARGDIIVQWDDDDWQSPDRIDACVRTLRGGSQNSPHGPPENVEPSFAYTSKFYWYHLAERAACPARSWNHGGSAGATFAYHRKAWEACPFRDVDQGEDNFFWQDHAASGTPMIDMLDPLLLVYIRHNRNGSHAISDATTPVDTEKAREILGADLAFYDELSEILPLDEVNNPHARWREQYDRSRGIHAKGRLRF